MVSWWLVTDNFGGQSFSFLSNPIDQIDCERLGLETIEYLNFRFHIQTYQISSYNFGHLSKITIKSYIPK